MAICQLPQRSCQFVELGTNHVNLSNIRTYIVYCQFQEVEFVIFPLMSHVLIVEFRKQPCHFVDLRHQDPYYLHVRSGYNVGHVYTVCAGVIYLCVCGGAAEGARAA